MTSHRLETRFCFGPESISGADIAELVEADLLGFRPRYVRGRQLSPNQSELSKVTLQAMRQMQSPEAVFLSADMGFGGENTFSASLNPGKGVLTLSWTLPERVEPPRDALRALCKRAGFNAGLSFDADDAFWQSLTNPNTYRALGGRTDGLIVRSDPEIPGRSIIDTRGNPGRLELLPGMWMGAAWRLYCGPSAIALLSRERLLSFEGAFSREVTDSGVVVTTLFRDPHESSSRAARETQARFRRWLNLDEIAEATCEAGVGEGGLLVEEGRFPHGGVRRVTARYDSEGKLAHRESAIREEVFELDGEGGILWRSGGRPLRGATE